jgi:hypothetical protein
LGLAVQRWRSGSFLLASGIAVPDRYKFGG